MTKNHKLAKAISDQGWSQVVGYLSYKLDWKGGQLVKINRFAPSSQLCSSCGNRQKMPLSIRTYNCPVCGLSIDRDYNAALNIKTIGLKIIGQELPEYKNACGDTSNGVAGIPVTNYVSNESQDSSWKQEKFNTLSVSC